MRTLIVVASLLLPFSLSAGRITEDNSDYGVSCGTSGGLCSLQNPYAPYSVPFQYLAGEIHEQAFLSTAGGRDIFTYAVATNNAFSFTLTGGSFIRYGVLFCSITNDFSRNFQDNGGPCTDPTSTLYATVVANASPDPSTASPSNCGLTFGSTPCTSVTFSVPANAQNLVFFVSVDDPNKSASLPTVTTNTPPTTVSNVTSSPVTANYTVGQSIPIQIVFTAPVTVTGIPQLALNSGGIAFYSSGSGTSTLTFTYTVGAADASIHLDYASTLALSSNGATIKDALQNSAILNLAAPGTAHSLGSNTNIALVGAFTISGQITVSGSQPGGVTVTLSGSQAGSKTTDASGNYAFTGLAAGGTYTVTPTLTSYSFSPPSATFVNLNASMLANFNAFPLPALVFYPITPCRVADTRASAGFSGAFGPPSMTAGSTRTFPIQSSSCAIPAAAQAYSLNFTVVPTGPLGHLTTWPAGQSMPNVSTLNDSDGTVVANAAIVPAGAGGAISIFVTDSTDVLFDINGYFAPALPSGLQFFTLNPCRIADTRPPAGFTGAFGPPALIADAQRSFPILSSACRVPAAALAYSLNFTVVPPAPLGFLTTWPTGQPVPNASTLNSYNGTVVANAAIVQAGTAGAISAFANAATDMLFDINGYFAPPSTSGLQFHPVAPCRIADTRSGAGFSGAFGPPAMGANTQRSFPIPSSSCGIPSTAVAYSLNFTVVPPAPLGFLTTWPTGQPMPNASTLNSYNGSVVANAAIVPAGTGGAISVFVNSQTDVLFDINGYFAP